MTPLGAVAVFVVIIPLSLYLVHMGIRWLSILRNEPPDDVVGALFEGFLMGVSLMVLIHNLLTNTPWFR